jgi:hypothetical protein
MASKACYFVNISSQVCVLPVRSLLDDATISKAHPAVTCKYFYFANGDPVCLLPNQGQSQASLRCPSRGQTSGNVKSSCNTSEVSVGVSLNYDPMQPLSWFI